MKALHRFAVLLLTWTLTTCGAPQAAQPTAAPSATQQVASAQPATVQPVVPTPTAAPPAPVAALAPDATPPPAPPAQRGERVLLLQEPRLQGKDVRAVQQRLLDLGYTQVGSVDGVFGPRTETAVRAFQQANQLQVDGVVGPQTRARLGRAEAVRMLVPIVVHTSSSYVLGGVQGQTWRDAPAVAPLLSGGEPYRVLPNQGTETTATGSRPKQLAEICAAAYTVTMNPALTGDAVAVGGDWPLQPRTPRELPAADPPLNQAVAAFLQSKGIAQPDVRITRATQIDLEGDGSNDIVVSATHLTSQDPIGAATGDYSFVAVQKTTDGTPTLVELQGNYFVQAGDFAAPNPYRVLGILDLNGDGVLEVVVNGTYYEGTSTSAFSVEGMNARALLTTGCGV